MLTALPAPRMTFSAVKAPDRNRLREKLFLEGNPEEFFVGPHPPNRSGSSHLVDHWPIDAVLGAPAR